MMSPPFFPIGPSALRGEWRFGLVPGETFDGRGLQRPRRRCPAQGRAHPGVPGQRRPFVRRLHSRPLPDGARARARRDRRVPRVGAPTGPRRRSPDPRRPPPGRGGGGRRVVRPCRGRVRRAPGHHGRGPPGRALPPSTGAHRRRGRTDRVPLRREPRARHGCRGDADVTAVIQPMRRADAIVVGAGPNGLVAALVLARAGLAVDVYEAADEPGGGCRTAELTLPGFRHDVCSAVHPLLLASPAFRDIDLSAHGVRLLTPPVAFAHPLGGTRAVSVGPERGRRGRVRWGRTGGPTPSSSRPSSGTWTRSCPPSWAPCATCRRIRWRRPASRCAGSPRPSTWPGASTPRRGGRSSPARPPTPCCRSRRRSPASSPGSSPRWRTATAGPSWRVAAPPSSTPSSPSSPPPAGGSRRAAW